MQKDLISVIVPVYNVEKYLDKCIESIVKQTYKNLEIILVDDGSTDNSGKMCDKWAQKDNRIKVIHKENGGVSSARNRGLECATGDFIGFIDSDDYCEQEMYEKMIQVFKQNHEIDLCYCDLFKDNKTISQGNEEIITKEQKLDLIYPFGASLWNSLLKKEKLKDIKFDEKFFFGEDLLFLVKYLLNISGNVFHLKIPLYTYSITENSITRQKSVEIFNKKYMNFIYVSKNVLFEIEKNSVGTKKYYMKHVDLIYHCCQKCKNLGNKQMMLSELKKYMEVFTFKQKLYYFLLKINRNSLYYINKMSQKEEKV